MRAIESVLDGLERARIHEGGMLAGGTKRRGSRKACDISLAVSLGDAAERVPPELAAKMREVASINDAVFAEANAGVGAASGGNLWSNAYGGSGLAGRADVCMLRYRQVGEDAYRRVVLQTAEEYRNREVNLSQPVWPGTMGNVILLMLNAHELTDDGEYLNAADYFARKGIELFLGDGCPLPTASHVHVHDHYEAVTNGDTLLMALLRLWQVRNEPTQKLNLAFTDR